MPRSARPSLFALIAICLSLPIAALAADAGQITGLGITTPKDDFVDVDVAFKVTASATRIVTLKTTLGLTPCKR